MAEAVLRRPAGLQDWQLWCLPAAIFLYALWGTPTPDSLGWPEVAIGLLLVAAVSLPRAARLLDLSHGAAWQRAGKLLLIYGFTLPVFAGLLAGNSAAGIVRDILPFLFLLLPLFFYPLWQDRGDHIRLLTGMVAVLGLVFALRVLFPAYMSAAGPGLATVPDPFLLANAPTVLFAALVLAGMGGLYLYRGRLAPGLLLLGLALVPLFTMALIGQRASIGVFILSALFLAGLGLWRRPLRVILPFALFIGALALGWPQVQEIGQGLLRKTALVGMNMRWQEAQAVMAALDGSFLSVLFGKGWGATVVSPAVGGATVNFTHSLLTTYWLKTGLVGMGLAVFYLYRLALLLAGLLFRQPVIALALAGPFLIDVLLYASFKSLDFGLVLLLIPLWAARSDSLHKGGGYSIQNGSPD